MGRTNESATSEVSMSGKTDHEEASRGFNRLVTVKDASRLAGVHRGIGQLYTQMGIISPTQSVREEGGWNRYGIIEIVELAVAKAMAEAGILLGKILEQFMMIRGEWPWDISALTFTPEQSEQLRIRLFDPFPVIKDWPEEFEWSLRSEKNTALTPSMPSDWPQWWQEVKDIIPFAYGYMISEPYLFFPPFNSMQSGDHEFWITFSALIRNFQFDEMGEKTNILFVDLAKIKARVGQAILDDGWFDVSNRKPV